MRLLALITLLATLLAPTTARITGFSAPSTIVPGAPIQIHFLTSNYIQRVQNVAVAFGITPVENYYPGSLGTFVGEKGLGPELSNIVGNITTNVSIPTSRPHGAATLTAALFSLYGAGTTGVLENFAVNVTVVGGNETSGELEYVSSEYVVVNSTGRG